MATLTLYRGQLRELKRHDRIVAIDDFRPPEPIVVAKPFGATGVQGVKTVYKSRAGVERYLYPDNVFTSLTVERTPRPKPKQVRITRYPMPLVRLPDGTYRTEDGRYEVFHNDGYLTTCEERHGSCPGNQEHEYARWCIWDTMIDDYLNRDAGGSDTLTEAVQTLVTELSEKE